MMGLEMQESVKKSDSPTLEKIKAVSRQCFVGLSINIISVSCAMAEGYSSVLLPQLEASNEWAIDTDSSSWIASMAALPMSIGCIIGGILMEKIGRKNTSIMTSIICTVGWLLIYFTKSMSVLLVGRFLTGICMGFLGPCGGVYIAETSDPKFRGWLLASFTSAVAFGLLLVHTLGTYFSWRETALMSGLVSAASLILIFAPESPTYLIKIGKIEQATKNFYWCRGKNDASISELEVLIERQKLLEDEGKKIKFRKHFTQMFKPEFYKPMVIMFVFFFACQWSGHNAVAFYSILIVQQAVGNRVNNFLAMTIIDVLRLTASILACFLSRILSRRLIVLSTGFAMSVCLSIVSIFTFFGKASDSHVYSYVALAGLAGYIFFLTSGFLSLTWVMMGEVFPQSSRGLGCGVSSFLCNVWLFTVVKSAPYLISDIGSDGTFMVYGLTGFIGTFILLACLPETKDKPLHEIEDRFKRRSKRSNVIAPMN